MLALAAANFAASCAVAAEVSVKCPATGLMLPETMPVDAVTLSDEDGGYELLRDSVKGIFEAQPENPPILLCNCQPDNFKKLKEEIGSKLAKKLKLVSAEGLDDFHEAVPVYMTWQQDYMKPQFDRSTGKPVAAMVPDYPTIGNLKSQLEKSLGEIGISSSHPKPMSVATDTTSGGNLDMLPGGICLMGHENKVSARDWDSYSKSMCGEDALRIPIETSWIYSGHIDELIRAIPNYKSSRACAYTVLIASPRKALQLLAEVPESPAFSTPNGLPEEFERMIGGTGLSQVCGVYQLLHSQLKGPHDFSPEREKAIESNTPLLRAAHSGALMVGPGPMYCPSMKSSDVLKSISINPVIREYNELVQKELDRIKTKILSAMKSKLPECEIDILDVPNLWGGAIAIDPDGSHKLAPREESSGFAMYPNPTNSTEIGRTLLMPRLYNERFDTYIESEVGKRGLKTVFLDTMRLHINAGNVHCSMQTLRSCQP
jgi:hypothetical protein